jgi:hypothetical protein
LTQGRVSRTFTPSDYFFRGPVYSVLFRPRAGEAYVLVTADAARVGQRYDSISIGTGSVYFADGGSWRYGVDASHSRVFSYEGAVQVIINDSDTKEKGPATGG